MCGPRRSRSDRPARALRAKVVRARISAKRSSMRSRWQVSRAQIVRFNPPRVGAFRPRRCRQRAASARGGAIAGEGRTMIVALGIRDCTALALSSAGTHAQEVVHGADSLFVSPAVKLAWAVSAARAKQKPWSSFVLSRTPPIASSGSMVSIPLPRTAKPLSRRARLRARPISRCHAPVSPIIRARSFISSREGRMLPPTSRSSRCSISAYPIPPGIRRPGEAEAYLARMLGQR